MSNATNANAPDGQMNDQEMPTTDGQMASNTNEEFVPPRSPRGDDQPSATLNDELPTGMRVGDPDEGVDTDTDVAADGEELEGTTGGLA